MVGWLLPLLALSVPLEIHIRHEHGSEIELPALVIALQLRYPA